MPALTDEDLMPCGIHSKKKMKDVPASYIDHIDGEAWIQKWPQVQAYITANRKLIDKELQEQGLI